MHSGTSYRAAPVRSRRLARGVARAGRVWERGAAIGSEAEGRLFAPFAPRGAIGTGRRDCGDFESPIDRLARRFSSSLSLSFIPPRPHDETNAARQPRAHDVAAQRGLFLVVGVAAGRVPSSVAIHRCTPLVRQVALQEDPQERAGLAGQEGLVEESRH